MTETYEDDLEDLTTCSLSPEREQELLDAQRECVFMWTNKAGEAVGVIVSYLNHDGKIWMTCAEKRARVSAIKRFPRASVCISSTGSRLATGKTVTYKGDCVIHKDSDVTAWFYDAFTNDRRSTAEGAAAYRSHLDSPGRVVIEFTPDWTLSFDSEVLWERKPEAATDSDDPRNMGRSE
jgi:general stress protein 26